MSEHQTEPRTTPWVAEDRFPKPVPLGEGSVGWIESELEEWLRNRIAAG